jgi:DNA-binding IclR family transcriptional regulator
MHHWATWKVMRALEAFAEAEEGLSVPDVAELLGVSVRPARMLVYQLVADRYLEALPGRHHRRWIVSNRARRLGTLLAASWAPDWPVPPTWVPKLHGRVDTPTRYREQVLRLVRERPGVTVYELSRALRVGVPTVYDVMSPLERELLVYKIGSGYEPWEDRRDTLPRHDGVTE